MTIITSLVIPCLLLNGMPTDMTRSEFAGVLAEIKVGESKTPVAKRLGTPDRVYNRTCDAAAMLFFLTAYTRHGPMRRHPLSPRDNPLNAKRSLMESAAWESYIQLEGSDEEMVYRQLVRMVYNVADIDGLRQLYDTPNSESWDDIARELDSIGIQWNVKEVRYVVQRERGNQR